jgi:hypothetical protein
VEVAQGTVAQVAKQLHSACFGGATAKMQRSNADVVKLKRVGGQCSGALCAILDTLLRFCPALVLALPWSWPCPGPGPGPAVTDGLGWLCVLDASLLCASRPGAGCQQGARDRPLEKIRERMLALVTADRVEGAARIAIAIAISQDGRVNNEWWVCRGCKQMRAGGTTR